LDNYPSKFKDELVAEFGEFPIMRGLSNKTIPEFHKLSKEKFRNRALDSYKKEYYKSLNKKKTFFDYTYNDIIDDTNVNIDSIIDLEKKHTLDLNMSENFDKKNDFIEHLFSEKNVYATQISWSFLDNLSKDFNDYFDEDIYAGADINEYKEIVDILFNNINKCIKELKFSFSSFSFMSAARGNKKRFLENKSINDIDEIVKEFNQINLDNSDIEFLNKSMSLLNINGKISIKRIQGVASILYLNQNQKLVSLSDLGYGYSQVIPILLKIILINKNIDRNNLELISKKKLILFNRSFIPFPLRNKLIYPTLIIEEPEANLHPNLQSKLADIIILANKTFEIHFILETHSEYFIRKLQFLTAKKEITKGDVNIYYFNSDEFVTINEEKIKKINIDEFGGLSDSFGPGFFDEATELKFDLLKLNQSQNN
jgi:predicted ATP-dependent endonuclease of OLD family